MKNKTQDGIKLTPEIKEFLTENLDIRVKPIKERLLGILDLIDKPENKNLSPDKRQTLLFHCWCLATKVEFVFSIKDIYLLYSHPDVQPYYHQAAFKTAHETSLTDVLKLSILLDKKGFDYNKEEIFFAYKDIVSQSIGDENQDLYNTIIINSKNKINGNVLEKFLNNQNGGLWFDFYKKYAEHFKWTKSILEDFAVQYIKTNPRSHPIHPYLAKFDLHLNGNTANKLLHFQELLNKLPQKDIGGHTTMGLFYKEIIDMVNLSFFKTKESDNNTTISNHNACLIAFKSILNETSLSKELFKKLSTDLVAPEAISMLNAIKLKEQYQNYKKNSKAKVL